jgi:hypothetical protein
VNIAPEVISWGWLGGVGNKDYLWTIMSKHLPNQLWHIHDSPHRIPTFARILYFADCCRIPQGKKQTVHHLQDLSVEPSIYLTYFGSFFKENIIDLIVFGIQFSKAIADKVFLLNKLLFS